MPTETKFPEIIDAILLAGGSIKDLPASEPEVPGKGHLPIGGMPMAARALKAMRESAHIGNIILVTEAPFETLSDDWKGVTQTAKPGAKLIDSCCAGLAEIGDKNAPALIVAGDLPFLTAAAIDDFIARCAERSEATFWYGFLSRSNSEKKYPGLRHTWAKIDGEKCCGTGLSAIRPAAVPQVRATMHDITQARKNPLKIANILGWKAIFHFMIGKLTKIEAEAAMKKILGITCAGINTPFAEAAYNVDDYESLEKARVLAGKES